MLVQGCRLQGNVLVVADLRRNSPVGHGRESVQRLGLGKFFFGGVRHSRAWENELVLRAWPGRSKSLVFLGANCGE